MLFEVSKKKKLSSKKNLFEFLPAETDSPKDRNTSSAPKTGLLSSDVTNTKKDLILPKEEKSDPFNEESSSSIEEEEYDYMINNHEDEAEEDDLEAIETIISGSEDLDEEYEIKEESLSGIKYSIPDPRKTYFLMSVIYDRKENIAALRCYEPDSDTFYFFRDPINHKPYCVSALDEATISRKLASSKSSFRIEEIQLTWPFTDTLQTY
ncbi:MAG: hypothetical protein ACFFBD_13065, partial [Candidatus Hodarchaeota archaeon]